VARFNTPPSTVKSTRLDHFIRRLAIGFFHNHGGGRATLDALGVSSRQLLLSTLVNGGLLDFSFRLPPSFLSVFVIQYRI
jgi:hypothetical protein